MGDAGCGYWAVQDVDIRYWHCHHFSFVLRVCLQEQLTIHIPMIHRPVGTYATSFIDSAVFILLV